MTQEQINQVVEQFVRERLSPPKAERDYISAKYEQLKGFLANSCFQSGSFARHTAIHPVHDLDVIWVTTNTELTRDSKAVLERLVRDLRAQYKANSAIQPEISVQSHSITMLFKENGREFAVDVVPAIPQQQLNQYGEPIYLVPSIQKMNPRRRLNYYATSGEAPTWILSDPRGYIKAASELDKLTGGRFRKSAKLAKAWRHKCKSKHGDLFQLKSFHLELIVTEFLTEKPSASVVESLTTTLERLPQRIYRPQYPDRADRQQFVDAYVTNLSQQERALILRLQSDAHAQAAQLAGASSEAEVLKILQGVALEDQDKAQTAARAATVITSTHQPWSY